jgi:hypothetical protein
LTDDYLSYNNSKTTERIRPNKSAATALLARVYLFKGDWLDAEASAGLVINNSQQYILLDSLNDIFLANSNEAIWQLKPVVPGVNTNEGQAFILVGAPNNVALTDTLVNSFESGDKRKLYWVGVLNDGLNTYYYPWKYKIQGGTSVKEYSIVLRLAEQYLIRAEARAMQDKFPEATSDLNIIRKRAGLKTYSGAMIQKAIIDAILHERQVELFCELGHRWLDLKRTNHANSILNGIKFPNWVSTAVLYPLPQIEINNNQKLTQNAGY